MLHGPANLAYNLYVPETLLQTKLYVPPSRPNVVPRASLIERLNQGLQLGHKLTLISAPAGFGKTTLVVEWLKEKGEGGRMGAEKRPDQIQPSDFILHPSNIAWLSLDEGDSDDGRFMTYLIAALQTISDEIGQGALAMLQSSPSLPAGPILTALINEIAGLPDSCVLVLDDYHLIQSGEAGAPAAGANQALAFLVEHLPPRMHLVIATREDPNLPLARLRARGQLTEVRASDLRFSEAEAGQFFNEAMGLTLSPEHVAALERRTEGWIAGLQLAAVALQGQVARQGQQDVAAFVDSFSGSHHFVLDYLIEEVLEQQPAGIQRFLLQTAILDRLNGALCDALTGRDDGQQTLEYLEQANLFIVPLDGERRWYRYHHLFADLLRRRPRQSDVTAAGKTVWEVDELHRRASQWFEEHGLEIEAFQHAAAANDIARAERLIEGGGVPLAFRGAVAPVIKWLSSLPKAELDARPSLWVAYAMATLVTGQLEGVEEKLQAAEAALKDVPLDAEARDIIGRIADTRGTMAVGPRQTETLIRQSRRALEYLHPDNLTYRTSTTWKLGVAYEFQGDRATAGQAYREAISISQASGNVYTGVLAMTGLGNIQLAENHLYAAAKTYQEVLDLVGDLPIPVACHVYLCQARIYYEWNDLEEALRRGQQSLQLARQYVDFSDIYVSCQVLLARLKLAQGDVAGAAESLSEARQVMFQGRFSQREAEVTEAEVLLLLRQGEVAAAADLAGRVGLPLAQARVELAQGDASAALVLLEPMGREMAAKGWADELIKVRVLEALAHHARGDDGRALERLAEALAAGEPGGFRRTFLDEGAPMAALLARMAGQGGRLQGYIRKLLVAFNRQEDEPGPAAGHFQAPLAAEQPLIEPLSEREMEVLHLIAEGLSNPQIAARLYLSANTVKVHARNIYGKLDVHSRTQAIARAQALGLLPPQSL